MSNTNIETEIQNIDNAMKSCVDMEKEHSYSARRILSIVIILTVALLTILFFSLFFPVLPPTDLKLSIPDTMLYAFLAIYTLTFSILMAIYRLHVGEASRLQHYIVGFMRIRVAGSNNTEGYKTEVREALTAGAFDYVSKPEKKGKLESPVPGHPGSEITTALLNKLLDGVEVVSKKTSAHNK